MPAHSDRAGAIIPELAEAYALGKMLDNSGWNGILVRHITPSDIDLPDIPLCFDNNGAVILADLSSSYTQWDAPRTLVGQRRLYNALIRTGPHCAVLCKHNVKPGFGRKIDTLRDIESFHVMVWDFEPVYSRVMDGAYWQAFVMRWVNERDGPLRLRRTILGVNVGLVKPSSSPLTETS